MKKKSEIGERFQFVIQGGSNNCQEDKRDGGNIPGQRIRPRTRRGKGRRSGPQKRKEINGFSEDRRVKVRRSEAGFVDKGEK